MIITLIRDRFSMKSTMGELFIDAQSHCYTLELPKGNGGHGYAIPSGIFNVVMLPSPHFILEAKFDPWVKQYAYMMPHIQNVPGRSDIMFHWGNGPADTDGCVLLGILRGMDQILQSREAFSVFYGAIKAPALAGNCRVQIIEKAPQVNTAQVEEAAKGEG